MAKLLNKDSMQTTYNWYAFVQAQMKLFNELRDLIIVLFSLTYNRIDRTS